VLRIEDTDQERSTPESVQAILQGLTWLGIDWDEGPGKGGPYPPYTQMEKLARYKQLAEELIAKGWAYKDYATEDEVKAARKAFAESKGITDETQLRQAGFQYKSPWRDATKAGTGPYTVRFKMPTREGTFGFDDLVLGRIDKPFSDVDDFVLLRTDGVPLYNFGCVVDDHDMQINHVGRGQEHINSTFPQLMLYEAFGWETPKFAHFPLILGPDREKLSKRKHPEADVMRHKDNGVLPHALLNFVVRLGWSHGNDELFTLKQLIEYFDFADVGRSSGVWNPEKLSATNEHWLKASPEHEVAAALAPFMKVRSDDAAWLVHGVRCFRERSKTLKEMAEKIQPYAENGVKLDAAAASKHLTAEGKAMLSQARTFLASASTWEAATLDPVVEVLAQQTGAKKGAIAQPIRVAVTGGTVSPGIGDTLQLLGREEALRRIDAALA
jgi:glutamyl-tRNA synthetase